MDAGGKEMNYFVVRYVVCTTGLVCERVIALKESVSITSASLFEVFKQVCKELELNWETDLVGQSYDGANNMKGQYNGLQALIRAVNKSAVYVWC